MQEMNTLDESELKRIGKNIKRLRKAKGMNQTALAFKANTRPTTISMIETGSNPNPGWELLDRISSSLDTNLHKLTMPPSSTVTDDISDVPPPPGLVKLLMNEDKLLSPSEDRITLQEVQWLKEIPEAREQMTAEDLLLILRQYRHIVSTWATTEA
jgi:transcriptional regulator with XRE-family HTH domain